MPRIALFLGAGASRPFGYPLTSEILPLIVERAEAEQLFGGPGCKTLREGLAMVFPGLAAGRRARGVLPQVTELLSLLDRIAQDGHGLAPTFPHTKVLDLRQLVERAVAEVLDGPFQSPLVERSLSWRRRWAKALALRARSDGGAAIITTNYDLLVESSLYETLAAGAPSPSPTQLAREVDYGFDWRMPVYTDHEPIATRPQNPTLQFFKLHGSLNWLKCRVCGYIYINPRGAIYQQAFTPRPDAHNTCTCGAWPLANVLVTPSIVRDVRDFNLLSVWNSALEALRTADEWIFVGYSLPGEDISLRSLLLRAYSGFRSMTPKQPGKPRITAYLYSATKEAPTAAELAEKGRYEALFPDIEIKWGGVLEHIADFAPVPAAGPES